MRTERIGKKTGMNSEFYKQYSEMLANTYANLSISDNNLSSKVAPKLKKQPKKTIQDSFFAPFSFNNTISDFDGNLSLNKEHQDLLAQNFNDSIEAVQKSVKYDRILKGK